MSKPHPSTQGNRSDKRYSVYPGKDATNIIGDTAPELNRALCRHAVLIRLLGSENEDVNDAIWALVDNMLKVNGL